MFQDVLHALSQLGLNQYDVKVYLACLHYKEGLFVHEITKETKIKRSTVYLAIKRLMEEGYLTKIKVGNRFKYFAERPEVLVLKHEKHLEELKTVAPLLARLGAQPSETEVKFFEGPGSIKQILRNAYLDLKLCDDPDKRVHYAFSSGETMLKVYPEMKTDYIAKRVQLGVTYKSITPMSSRNNPAWTVEPKELREVRYYNDTDFPFEIMFETFVDSVYFFSPRKPAGGVLIKNSRIAASVRNLHRLLWSLLPAPE